jgi:Protein of unknwon function (DUF3310)
MMNEHKCNQCFYAQYEKDEAPCSGCTGYSKFIKRDIYIKTPTSAPSFQPLQKAIDEWHREQRVREQKLNEGCNGLSSKELNDAVNRPKHYTEHPSGIECIEVTEHMGFNLGNAVKYIWRCDLKKDAIEDLKKAKWYIEREIAKRVDSNF